MKLADLRRVAIRRQVRIHFRLPNGMDCTVTESGVVKIPELHSVPDFNVEAALPVVESFQMESAGTEVERGRPKVLSVPELEKLIVAAAPGATAVHEHDE
jgi:uncharacterized protein YjlB